MYKWQRESECEKQQIQTELPIENVYTQDIYYDTTN